MNAREIPLLRDPGDGDFAGPTAGPGGRGRYAEDSATVARLRPRVPPRLNGPDLVAVKVLPAPYQAREVGSARMSVLLPEAGSWRRVASLQWSLLGWLMMTRSGSAGSSASEDTHGATFCVVVENLEWNILEGPVSQGSSRMVKGCCETGTDLVVASACWIGSKDKRNEASELSCLMVKAMLAQWRCGARVSRSPLAAVNGSQDTFRNRGLMIFA
ncbi:hypothetical protein G7054_g14210 [Neopestalotiopsis clavispora]|nr:hypothetical protein G7054_g14210 [Neopestalotiopsis clavispora]